MVKLRNCLNNQLIQSAMIMTDNWLEDDLDLDKFSEGIRGTTLWYESCIGTYDANGIPCAEKQKKQL